VVIRTPRVVIAAPASGHGKTTVATGLMAALAGRGLAVSPHKVGPDYIDPGYHALAAGRPGRNLDPFLIGEQRIPALFGHGARGADVAVIEGVMGLYDGVAGRGEYASTAHVAKLLNAPVLLVVDAAAQGRSVAALVAGFRSYDPLIRLGGVILNRVGSPRHEQILREAVTSLGVPVLGVLRRDGEIATPSRHLGLVPTAERRRDAAQTARRLGEVVGGACDVERIVALARSAPPLTAEPWDPGAALAPDREVDQLPEAYDHDTPSFQDRNGHRQREVDRLSPQPARPVTNAAGLASSGDRPRVAVAGGAAFSFGYPETAELLAAAGAEVVSFDPLADEALPDGTKALVLGGGFPEMYAAELSANERLRKEVAELAVSGGAVAAECAGLLYLARSLDGQPMCGVLNATGRMTPRLTLGYRQAVAAADSPLARPGEVVHGHEFHRTACDPPAGATAAWLWDGRPEGFTHRGVHASYLHLHWAGYPQLARRLVAAVRR
jgi:cobyrinic acid a,c-diamide synthase